MFTLRRATISALVGVLLALTLAGTTLAASLSVGFGSSYAQEDLAFAYGGGSVTYKPSSGITGYLRATAQGDVFNFGANVPVSRRAGGIDSVAKRYTGPTGGSIRYTVRGSFSRDLSGGISLANGAFFRHVILFALLDTTTKQVVHSWTFADETILCGGLVYPVGVGGCNGNTSDTYPSAGTRTASGNAIVYGHYYAVRIVVASIIDAGGVAGGLQARTTAHSLSGTLSW